MPHPQYNLSELLASELLSNLLRELSKYCGKDLTLIPYSVERDLLKIIDDTLDKLTFPDPQE